MPKFRFLFVPYKIKLWKFLIYHNFNLQLTWWKIILPIEFKIRYIHVLLRFLQECFYAESAVIGKEPKRSKPKSTFMLALREENFLVRFTNAIYKLIVELNRSELLKQVCCCFVTGTMATEAHEACALRALDKNLILLT